MKGFYIQLAITFKSSDIELHNPFGKKLDSLYSNISDEYVLVQWRFYIIINLDFYFLK